MPNQLHLEQLLSPNALYGSFQNEGIPWQRMEQSPLTLGGPWYDYIPAIVGWIDYRGYSAFEVLGMPEGQKGLRTVSYVHSSPLPDQYDLVSDVRRATSWSVLSRLITNKPPLGRIPTREKGVRHITLEGQLSEYEETLSGYESTDMVDTPLGSFPAYYLPLTPEIILGGAEYWVSTVTDGGLLLPSLVEVFQSMENKTTTKSFTEKTWRGWSGWTKYTNVLVTLTDSGLIVSYTIECLATSTPCAQYYNRKWDAIYTVQVTPPSRDVRLGRYNTACTVSSTVSYSSSYPRKGKNQSCQIVTAAPPPGRAFDVLSESVFSGYVTKTRLLHGNADARQRELGESIYHLALGTQFRPLHRYNSHFEVFDDYLSSKRDVIESALWYSTADATEKALRPAQLSLLETLAEFGQNPVSPKTLLSLVKACKNFNRLDGMKSLTGDASRLYLQKIFAVDPTRQTIDELSRFSQRSKQLRGTSHGRFNIALDESPGIDHISRATVVVRTKLVWTITAESLAASLIPWSQTGLNPLELSNIWDTVPMSWLLDMLHRGLASALGDVDTGLKSVMIVPEYVTHSITAKFQLSDDTITSLGVTTQLPVSYRYYRRWSSLFLPRVAVLPSSEIGTEAMSNPNIVTLGAFVGALIF